MDNIFPLIGAARKISIGTEEDDALLDYHSRIRAMVVDARDYNDNYLAEIREENTRYYKGEEPFLDEEGRSTIVATEVRDTVMAMMPSLMRIFTGHEHVVEYAPRTEEDVPMAEQATDYVSYVFWEDNPGYLNLHAAIKDALIRRTGILAWDTAKSNTEVVRVYKNITPQQVAVTLELMPGYQVVRQKPNKDGTFDLTIKKITEKTDLKIWAVAPDEFRVDRNARSVESADLIGWEMLKPASELVGMGYPKELVEKHMNSASSIRWNEERTLRNPGLDMDGAGRDSADGYVAYGEFYIRIDEDGDGVSELHHICVMGDSEEVVSDELVDRVKIAVFTPEPEPHSVIGESTAELVMDLQKIKTGIMRGSLDSLSSTIYPRTVVNETTTNMDDVLNTEIGAPIRTKSDPSNSVVQLNHSFVGEPAFNMLNYLDMTRAQRTGISDASKGLDPKALQSTNVKGVDMVITGAQERIELVARNLCETGMKSLFKGLLQEITDNPPKERIVQLRGKFVPVKPSEFDATMDVKVNPAIGRGTDSDRMMILSQVKATQEAIIQQMGADNPLCGPIEYRNTLEDLLAIANLRNTSRYFKRLDPAQLQALAQANAQKKDPAEMIAEAEIEKIRANTAKAIGEKNYKDTKLQLDEDFRRDKMETDAALKMAELSARGEQQMNVETVRAVNNQSREAAKMEHDAGMKQADREHAADQAERDRVKGFVEKDNDMAQKDSHFTASLEAKRGQDTD